jgi:hypothetical protein
MYFLISMKLRMFSKLDFHWTLFLTTNYFIPMEESTISPLPSSRVEVQELLYNTLDLN